ncbi:Sodium channel protein type 4 subunit alpha [Paramecium bursaria]
MSIILALFITNFYYDNVLLIDFSTMRIFRILLFMSIYIKKLQLMLIALSKSVKFLIETLIIIILFTTFFALVGMHLFNGLFRLRCFDESTNEATEELCGYAQKCEHGSILWVFTSQSSCSRTFRQHSLRLWYCCTSDGFQ